MEEWKQIVSYPNYSISNFGNVKNNTTQKQMRPSIRSGYDAVVLRTANNRKMCTIHRLVLTAFNPNSEPDLTVNHKDHNKLNNNITNLEWATMKEQNNHQRKPSIEQMSLMGARCIWRVCINTNTNIEMYKSIKEAHIWAQNNNLTTSVNGSVITAVLRGNRKTAYGYIWKYDISNEVKYNNEEWKNIPKEIIDNNEGYKISNMGRLKSDKGRITEGSKNLAGYLRVTVKNKRYSLHRLVAQVFITNPENKPFVNHKDGNKENSKLENLEWMTGVENTKHAHDSGFFPNTKPIVQYDKNMNKINIFKSMNEAENILNIKASSISMCCNNIKGKLSCGGFIFKYQDDKTVYKPYTYITPLTI